MRNRKRTGDGDLVFNPKRRLRPWSGEDDDIHYGASLAKKVRYTGNPAHKRDPGDFNLTPPAASRKNATLCDDAGVFKHREAIRLLKDGAKNGLVDSRSDGEFPLLIWSVRQDGVVFEAELENCVRGDYHGYPMPLRDPFRTEVLQAFGMRNDRD